MNQIKSLIVDDEVCWPLIASAVVNLMCVLILFVVLGTRFMTPAAMAVSFPKSSFNADVAFDITITITGENVIYFNGQVVTVNELKRILVRVKGAAVSVIIKADEQASLNRLRNILDICRSAGIERVYVATAENS